MKVFVPSSAHKTVKVYHTSKCQNVRGMKSVIETTKAKAQNRGLRECKACAGENYQQDATQDRSYYNAAVNAGKSGD